MAARAGVSFQTISKVLNGKGSVSSETRERILVAARELGYVPNVLARGLVKQSARTIGVVSSDLGDHALARFVVGAEREARRQGHTAIVGIVDRGGEGAERYLRALVERRVDGVLMAAPQLEENKQVGEFLRGHQVPIVSIHRVPGGGVSLVGSDHSRTGFLATRHLLEQGRRVVATVMGVRSRRVTHSRMQGYERALKRAGMSFDPRLVDEGHWEPEGAYRATLRLLDRVPELTAIFVHSDTMALGVLAALRDKGLSAPEDCAVVGCDDLPTAAYTAPPLTTVRVPFYETGEVAARLLFDLISGRKTGPERVLLPVGLVCRASCGCGGADESPVERDGGSLAEKDGARG